MLVKMELPLREYDHIKVCSSIQRMREPENRVEIPLREYNHIKVRSTVYYLTAVNKSRKEIFDHIK